jgi:electron transfer flavoprotein alpha subunit
MILVVAEARDGKLNRATWEALAAAQRLSPDGPIVMAAVGARMSAVAAELAGAAAAGVAEVVAVESPALDDYTADGYVAGLAGAIAELKPRVVVLPHTYQTRDFAPKLAARLDASLVTDVTGVTSSGSGAPTFSRPMFQGKLTADVVPQGPEPHLVTIQIGAFRADDVARQQTAAPVRALAVEVDARSVRQKADAPFQEVKQAVDLSQAERIVSVGRGIKEEANIALARRLAESLGAELAASRPICDAGWLPMERQVGSSGQTVAPKLYVALGISGAIQHLVGMKGSQIIVAINKDPDAPIFEVADLGIVGDLFEVVPAIIDALKR